MLLVLQSHPPVADCSSGKSVKVLWEVLPRVLPKIRVLRGGAPESAQGVWGVLQGVLPRVLNVGR